MSDHSNNMTPEDWRDRLLERALEESLGGAAPPDLSEQIFAAADNASQPGDLTMATAPAPQKFGFRNWVLAASLIINCGLATVLFAPGGGEPPVAIRTEEAQREKSAPRRTLGANDDATPQANPSGPLAAEKTADFDSLVDTVQSTVAGETGRDESERGGDNHPRDSKQPTVVIADGADIPALTGKGLDISTRQNSFGLARGGKEGLGQQAGEASATNAPVAGRRGEQLAERNRDGQRHVYRSDDVEYKPMNEAKELELSGAQVNDFFLLKSNLDSDGDGAENFAPTQRLTGMPAQPTPGKPKGNGSALGDINRRTVRHDWSRENAIGYGVNGDAGIKKNSTPYYAGHFYSRAGFETWELGMQAAVPRDHWGFRGRHRGFDFVTNGRWQGSPDGEGVGPGASGDQYDRIHENPFIPAFGAEAISTFSIDVDTASYANVRQMLLSGHRPPADAVRIEELVNYFDYGYEGPSSDSDAPFAAHVETAGCPWKPEHRLVRIGIKGREVEVEKRPLSNLVFLVDISGSMSSPEKLPLVKQGLKKLAEQLGENDRVAIVVYASQEGLALPSTPGTEQESIALALDNLQSGGSTAGGAGITLAYQIAEDNFIEGGVNRVILCTDGDFNVGTTSTAELERLVEQKAKDTKVFLSAIGFGRGNLNDAMMEKITGIGNGNYYYADGEREAERIFVKGMTGMLVTIAKDVKIQVEFNPAKVAGYRLLGYENRMLKTQDFNDDTKDAGEIGAGHTVTCLYEIVPAGEPVEAADIDELKYQVPAGLSEAADTGEMLTLKMRYKQPDEDKSSKLQWPISDAGAAFGEATGDLQFAASVASFGMLLRGSQYAGNANFDAVLEIAQSTVGEDPQGERVEFVELVRAAKRLMPEPEPATPVAESTGESGDESAE